MKKLVSETFQVFFMIFHRFSKVFGITLDLDGWGRDPRAQPSTSRQIPKIPKSNEKSINNLEKIPKPYENNGFGDFSFF